MFKHTLPIMLLGLALSWTVEAAPRSYGPVKDQDTLWNIADQLRPDNSATVQQTMLAIYYKNPQAFASNNINSLMKGVVIKAPTSAEARRYQRLGALREARKHNNYWKRGANLPKTTPPPVPKTKASKSNKRSKQVVAKTTVSYAATPKNTNRRLAKLHAQLQAAETKNQQLSAELTALQAKQNPSKPNPKLDAQVKKLKIELQELTTVLDQKDNHIKTLQSSLKNASETIKAQHADNMRLYDKLKEVSPNSVPAPPSSEGKSELKLSTVEAATAAVAAASKVAAEASKQETKEPTPAAASDDKAASTNAENKETNAKSVWADEKPVTDADKTAKSAEGTATKTSSSPAPTSESKPTGSETTTTKPNTEPQTLAAAVPSNSASATNKTEATKLETKTGPVSTAATTDKPADTNKAVEKAETRPADAKTEAGSTASQSPSTTSTETVSDIKAPSNAKAATTSEPTNDVKTLSSVPVSQMLSQTGNQSGASVNKAATPATSTPLRGVSPLALAVALISLLFILALIWRAVLQQREMRRLEEEESRVAERMRKRLDDNQATVPTSATLVDKKDPELETEIKF